MMTKRDKREFADMFKALGDPTRLKIYQFLQGRCWPHPADTAAEHWIENGPTVSEVCTTVTGSKKITSKVSQHLKELRIAGLITIERRGKNMICGVNHSASASLIGLLSNVEAAEPSAPMEESVVVEQVLAAHEPVKSKRKSQTVTEAAEPETVMVHARRKIKSASNGDGPAKAATAP
jgi:ArsR family transcriptional regulator